MDHKPFLAAVALVTGMWISADVRAQDLSDTEIAARFAAQRDAIRAVAADPALGPTRGLVLTNIEAAGAAPGVAVEPPPAPPGAATADAPLVLTPAASDEMAATAPAGVAPPAGDESGTPVLAHWTLPEDEQVVVQVTFAFDSAVLEDSQKPMLATVCSAMKKAGVGVLRIVGHTDASGSEGYNQQLSVLRAEEVKRFFVSDCQVPADRLQAVGVGEQFPFNDRDPMAGVNRRVEFQAIS